MFVSTPSPQVPRAVSEKVEASPHLRKLLYDYFGDADKVDAWLRTPNPAFGFYTPREMIALDREHKVLAFVLVARD